MLLRLSRPLRLFKIILFALALMSLTASSATALKDGLYKPGTLTIAGRAMRCGKTKTLVSSKYWRAGGSVPGIIGLNPRKLKKLPKAVQWMIFTHECGHQTIGKSEARADCWAAKRGRKQGWLTRTGLKQICRTLRNDPAKFGYPTGKKRCQIMRRCYRK